MHGGRRRRGRDGAATEVRAAANKDLTAAG